MPDWSIKIIPNPAATADKPALLMPDLVGAKPGDPLEAQEDDLVSWNNETGQPYQPWPTDENYNLQTSRCDAAARSATGSVPFSAWYLSDMIPGKPFVDTGL